MNTNQHTNPFRCDPPWSDVWGKFPRPDDSPFNNLPWFSDAWKLVPREDGEDE